MPHSFPSPSMPLQEASPRLPAPRYHQPSKPRRALLENIEELFGMFAVLGARLYVMDYEGVPVPSSDSKFMNERAISL